MKENVRFRAPLSSVHTKLLAMAMQKWVKNFAKEYVQYPFLAMPANPNSIANAQCERILTQQWTVHH